MFSALIIERIKKHLLKRDIKHGIKTELRELLLRLAADSFSSILEYSEISEKWSKWFKPYYKTLKESDEYDYLRDKPRPNLKIDNYSDKEFYDSLVLIQSNNRANEIKPTLIFPKIMLPYIDSNYYTISLLKNKFIKQIFKLKREIIHLNSDYEQVWFYHTKTFESITYTNHTIAIKNIENLSKKILREQKNIIHLIEIIILL